MKHQRVSLAKKVELRHVQGDETEVYIYDEDERITRIVLLDAVENGRSYKPTKINHVSFIKDPNGGEKC